MIENLRYYIINEGNGNRRLRVCWNWVGVSDRVRAHCRLVKRLTGEVISEIRGITVDAYRQERCGYMLDMPTIPVQIEVSDDPVGDVWARCIVKEAPPYLIEATCKPEQEEVGRFFTKRTNHYLRFRADTKAGQLTDRERDMVPGWILSGVANGQRFFFDRLDREYRYKVPSSEAGLRPTFEIVPEAERTIYHGMFRMTGGSGAAEPSAQMNSETESVCFEGIKRRQEGNRFYRIKCPYCFEEFEHSQAVFRSVIYSDGIGYAAEVDEKFAEFVRIHKLQEDSKKGHVIDPMTGTEEMLEVEYATDPDRWVAFNSEDAADDVIIGVKDHFGNRTTQKLCPHCHNNIPTLSGLYPMVNITMMGDTGTGKTVYLAAMLHQLETGALLPGYHFQHNMVRNTRGEEVKRIYRELIAGEERAVVPAVPAAVAYNAANAQPEQRMEAPDPFGSSGMFPGGGADLFSQQSTAATDVFSANGFGVDFSFDPETDEIGESTEAAEDMVRFDEANPEDDPVDADAPATSEGEEKAAVDEEEDYGLGDLDINPMEEDADAAQRPASPMGNLRQQTTRDYIPPVIYELKGQDPDTREATGVILCFFDFPGEAIREGAVRSAHDRYLDRMISESDGMIFLFDPSTLKRVRGLEKRIQNGLLRETMGAEAQDQETKKRPEPAKVLDEFAARYIGGMMNRVRKPVSFVISKSDAIRDYLRKADADLQRIDTFFLDESVYALDQTRKSVYTGEIKRASKAIVSFMDDAALQGKSEAIMDDAGDSVWICVSSIGIAPDENGTMYQRHGVPVHVMEPVEWILARMSAKNKPKQ